MSSKVFLITGGSSGIGLRLAEKLSVNNNHKVISFSRSREKIDRALKQMPHLEGKADFVTGDASCMADIKKLFSYLQKEYGVIHGLVNNAAILNKGTMETISVEEWKHTMDINLSGPYMLTKILLPLLKQAGGSAVVNISSVAGLKPGTSIAYSVSKAGLDMLTRFLAGDLAPYKIRVNSINPGLVKTNIHMDNQVVPDKIAYNTMLEKAYKRYPAGRVGEADDIASMAEYLLSEKAAWITGSIIPVDGGIMVENDLIPPKENHQ
ncbi:MAG: SDR family oxidoreductase [Bacteroidales bacterium]